MISILLPKPPSINAAYGNRKPGTGGRGRYPTKVHREWKEAAGWTIVAAKLTPISGPYRFAIYLPLSKRFDASNFAKLAEDLFVSLGVTPDDRHMVSSLAEKHPDIPPGMCRVVIEEAA
jgi:hypothetical protein